ncbi:MAG: hypothetical protein A3G34_00665 [Candidatus Lindowbacteria bacterium RIFCSPLOWO2_12_FULL_62_27]|nr:MAG: hypothetical protein A3G34_00665 [Candidatus Lindowbacteria bacterium RIFCSPLOWO2_12_FULL_62_27]OGH58176.1 MAG: hypothetical protein A3I06_00885 [Candidatus Lindowbacteria bacterium RIFCSPLOWO2_02_FULL_62_12]
MEIFPGIDQNPDIRFGKPCLKGTRIDVATIIGGLAAGDSEKAICGSYRVTARQIKDALRYAAHISEYVPPARRSAA